MLCMDGAQHRRYRTLVQPSFVPKAQWWTEQWIEETVDAADRRIRRQRPRRPQRRLLRRDPGAHDHRQLRRTGRTGPRHPGRAHYRPAKGADMSAGRAARREQPQDDLISVLVEAEITDEDGATTGSPIARSSFVLLLLGAGSGTTWKQMGITLAALLQRPDVSRPCATTDRC